MTRRLLIAGIAAAAMAAAVPSTLAGQAVCSAPHSSPALNETGAVRTLPPGAAWVQLSLYQQRSVDFYGPAGERRDFLADAVFLTRSGFLTAAVGALDGLELWVQAPVHRLTVRSGGGDSETVGLGDLRLAARVGPGLFGRDLPLALRLGVKIPGGEFPVDATILPLSEGQMDAELRLEAGHAFERAPLHVVAWAGYRVRGENRDAARKPGDEMFAHLGMGGELGAVSWQVAADGLWGGAPRAQRLELPAAKRRLLLLAPALGIPVAGGTLELAAQLPVAGRNLPAGAGMTVAYRHAWGLQDPFDAGLP